MFGAATNVPHMSALTYSNTKLTIVTTSVAHLKFAFQLTRLMSSAFNAAPSRLALTITRI